MIRKPLGTAALAAATLLAGALFAGDAAADWLVLEDGSRVETKDAWEVKGRQIVFRTADGTLSSLKTEQVDLEASREATRAAVEGSARPAPPPAAEPKPETPRRKFTNADIPRGALVAEPIEPLAEGAVSEADAGAPPAADPSDQDLAGADDFDDAAGDAPAADAAPRPRTGGGRSTDDVVVTAWDRQDRTTGDGIEIAGTVRNNRPGTMASAVEVVVVLYDRSGQELASVAASVEPTSIPDGGTADFAATFPDVYDFGAVRFNASSRALSQGQGEPGGATTPNI